MEYSVKDSGLETKKNTCIVTSVFEQKKLSASAKKLDEISNGYISELLLHETLVGKLGKTILLHYVPNVESERILLVGCGEKKERLSSLQYKRIFYKIVNMLGNISSKKVLCFLTELNIQGYDVYWKIRKAIEFIEEALYNFNQFKTNQRESCYLSREVIFNVQDKNEVTIGQQAVQHALAIVSGINSAKNLGNMPPNICNSSYLVSQAYQLANIFKKNITVNVIDKQKMCQMGMNSYLAVGSGSKNEPIMLVIEYKGSFSMIKKPIVLIGKGVTFDSGGISIKPSKNMDEMKYDMCGAAAVYGVMRVAAQLQLPLNIVGILASCENMPGSHAYRPGDILKTMSGKSVEILNTDAEGRLVLCDVLTYVERFKPEIVIDIATLTGACVIALGHHITGLMSNHDLLANELLFASEQSGDRAWRLPLSDEFQEQLRSNFADMTNVGGKSGGAITAGCFLSRFSNQYNWAHLDIAGTAWRSEKNKSATGRPVAMLSQFLINRANSNKAN